MKNKGTLIAMAVAGLIVSGQAWGDRKTEKKEQNKTQKTVKCKVTEKSTCGGPGGCGGHTVKKEVIETSPEECEKKGGKIVKKET